MESPQRRRLLLTAILAPLAVILGVGVWVGVTLSQFASALQQTAGLAQNELTELEPATLAALAEDLERTSSSPALGIVELLPQLGPEIGYLRTLTKTTADLLQPAAAILQQSATLFPKDDRPGISIDFDTYRAIAKEIAKLDSGIGALQTNLSNRPTIAILPIADQLSGLESRLTENRELLDELIRYAQIGEVVLAKKSQRWFIATQNLAEARATGGMIGSYVVIKASNNRIDIETVGAEDDLLAMQSLKDEWVPDQIRNLYDYVDWRDWRDVNSWPETEPVAKAIKQGWDDGTGKPIDGVLFLGQGVIAELVALAGGVNLDGHNLTGDNAAQFFAEDIYLEYPDVDEKNALLVRFSYLLVERLTAGPLEPADFAATIKANATGDRLFGWVADPELQERYKSALQTFALADLAPDQIYFASNNAGGNKLDAYLHYSFEQTETGLELTVTNSADPSQLTDYMGSRLDLRSQGIDAPLGLARNYLSFFYPKGFTPTDASGNPLTPADQRSPTDPNGTQPSCFWEPYLDQWVYICDVEVEAGGDVRVSLPHLLAGGTRIEKDSLLQNFLLNVSWIGHPES